MWCAGNIASKTRPLTAPSQFWPHPTESRPASRLPSPAPNAGICNQTDRKRNASGVAPDSRSTTISPAERKSGQRGLRRDAEAGTRNACAPRKLPPLTAEPGEKPTLSPDEPFASWLGLGPDNRLSGGRILKAGTRKVANRIATILRLAANSLGRAKGRMGDFVRRFKGRLGKAEGIVAGAHKLARIIWAMVVSGRPYDEAKAFDTTPAATSKTFTTKPTPLM